MDDTTRTVLGEEGSAAVDKTMADLADLASFVNSASDGGQSPRKLFDAVRLLLIIQEAEFRTGTGVGRQQGLRNRFREQYGRDPMVDVGGLLGTADRLSLISRDWTVQLTSKGSRLLGTLFRVILDWHGFHQKSDLEQLIYQSQRELEMADAYENYGYQADSLPRALAFLERGYRDLQSRLREYILEGLAMDQISALIANYDRLQEAIAAKRVEGYELTLPIIERLERSKAAALRTAYEGMEGVLAHSTGRVRAEMSLINKTRFYTYLQQQFATGELADLAGRAGDVALPVSIAAYPSARQLEESIAETLGRTYLPGASQLPGVELSVSAEGRLDEEDYAFDEDLRPYVDRILEAVGVRKTRESSILALQPSWSEALMVAVGVGELVTKEHLRVAAAGETYQEERFELVGDLTLARREEDRHGEAP
ncbi:MAG: hypothetical protein AB1445_09965 [Bacillota bacterium]